MMLKQYYPWMIFVGFLLLLTFSSSNYSTTIDAILWPVRLGLIAGLSILFARSRWRHRAGSRADRTSAPQDSTDHFLSSIRRWYYGDPKK
jgi:hypothetical protein